MAVRPPASALRGDELFYGTSYRHVGDASHWLEPARKLAEYGRARGIEFHTDDMVDLRTAAVLILGEVPSSRGEVARLRREYPHLKLILEIVETPIGRDWVFDPANHADFDAVLSYDPALNDGERYFSFRIPMGGLSREVPAGEPWDTRRIACIVAHVPNVRPLVPRRSGAGVLKNGWRFTARTWWDYVTEGGSLYAERLGMARQCAETFGDRFDIYGPGWPLGSPSFRGPFAGSKLDLLQRYRFTIAYENCGKDNGYLTEKLFDALLAGCVPVYLGNPSVGRDVPERAFIDVRKYGSRREVAELLARMPEADWQEMRAAGADFLRRGAGATFGWRQYAEAVIAAVERTCA